MKGDLSVGKVQAILFRLFSLPLEGLNQEEFEELGPGIGPCLILLQEDTKEPENEGVGGIDWQAAARQPRGEAGKGPDLIIDNDRSCQEIAKQIGLDLRSIKGKED